MLILIKQLILKYQFKKHDLMEAEKFREVKLVNEMISDLMKLHELKEK